jgi:rhamnogalacturonan endolyase
MRPRRISSAVAGLVAAVLAAGLGLVENWSTAQEVQRGARSAGRKVEGFAKVRVRENLDRGLIAVPADRGLVYLSWRLLPEDGKEIAFDLFRKELPDGKPEKVNPEPIRKTTDFVDRGVRPGIRYRYEVRPIGGTSNSSGGIVEVTAQDRRQNYLSIKLDGDHTFQKVGIADLDGDGRYDFVIKQPNENIDPYELYWKPSPGTYNLEAYRSDGKFLWRYDLGWAIERGIWYSPYVVYDLDGDGRAEVAVKIGEGDPRDPDGRVRRGPEYLAILDGLTGKIRDRVDWPSREGFGEDLRGYNYASRNQMCVAYLDGKTPCLVVCRGTYTIIKLVAYQFRDGKLEELWRWDNTNEPRSYWGQGAHTMKVADVDGDSREEIILGSAVIDDDGTALWSIGLGHPDHAYVGDIDPERPGLEIYYGIESRQRERNGMCLVEAATGKILWGYEGPTRHVHAHGMCSDIIAKYPGSECYSADTDEKKDFAWGILWSAKGEIIAKENLAGFGPRVVFWDADPQRELLIGRRIADYGASQPQETIEGTFVAVADILGDWREELIVTLPGEMRIYLTTTPAQDRRPTLMSDLIYRMDVVIGAMGYYQCPMLSYDLATTPPW